MGSSNSQGEICLEIYSKLLLDLSTFYPKESYCYRRDLRTLKRRYLSEGPELFTVTLPRLGKALDYALELGLYKGVEGFKRQNNSVLPELLGALFNRVFDSSGNLVHHDVDAIRNLRQMLYFAYKLECPHSESLICDFLDGFVQTDSSIDNNRDYEALEWGPRARSIIESVLHSFDFKEIKPKHGPGAVATGERYDEKWTFKRLYRRIHNQFPYYDYYVTNTEHLRDSVEHYMGMARLESGTAKVVLVPKDSRGPRLISCEPLEYQYIQQGIMRKLVPWIEFHPLTRGRINFTDQKVNAALAKSSSDDRKYATLDLKDASDLVSQGLVKFLFGTSFKYLEATRSTHTLLPDGRVVELKKFAPMGSALCFPVEALCFWSICVSAVSTFTGWEVWQVARDVYVYGDDIIVKDEWYGIVVKALEEAGLRVNLQKSFTSGFFRESCGTDAYKGADVTPVRLRTLWSGRPGDGSALASYCSYANMLKWRGYEQAAEYLYGLVENTYGLLPYGTNQAPYPCREVLTRDEAIMRTAQSHRTRLHAELQHVQVKCKTVGKQPSQTELDGWSRLLRNLLVPQRDPEQVVGAAPLKINTRWTFIR